MEHTIWEMQQEAARRVARTEQENRRVAMESGFSDPLPYRRDSAPSYHRDGAPSYHRDSAPSYRRTTASMRAQRPPPFAPPRASHNLPPTNQNLPQCPKSTCDKEQLLLLLLALYLAKNGGSATLVLALLYLAF